MVKEGTKCFKAQLIPVLEYFLSNSNLSTLRSAEQDTNSESNKKEVPLCCATQNGHPLHSPEDMRNGKSRSKTERYALVVNNRIYKD